MKNVEECLDEDKKLIDEYIYNTINSYTDFPEILKSAMIYILCDGGKRIRPILVLVGARLGNIKEIRSALPLCFAVELIHSYSLVHDDLPALDNDDYRRGKLALHKRYSETLAILTGDALLSLAFYVLSKEALKQPQKFLKIIYIISEAIGPSGMIAGQVCDLDNKMSHDIELLDYIYLNKTAKLIQASLICGYILGEKLDLTIKKKLLEFGRLFGIAYQLHDDIQDFNKEKKRISYPNLIGIGRSKEKLRDIISEVLDLVRSIKGGEILAYLACRWLSHDIHLI